MTDTMMDFSPFDGGFSPLGGMKEALASFVRNRWPVHTQKTIEREWGLTIDEAKGLIKGQASVRTIEKVLAHKNGGWAVALPIMGGVIGHGLTDYIASERDRLNHEAEQRQRRAAALREAEGLLDALRVGAGPDSDRPHLDRNTGAGMVLHDG
ncbi:hypothetical protein ACIGFJ_12670 [Brevundimonas diminuta]|uniref:hypothetical protein n=1 Tax=Brevundimonas diminuta TaxID=293 RepID=UPI0037C63850